VALQDKLTKEEIEFMEAYYYPPAMIESLTPENFKAPHLWKEEDVELLKIRPYQYGMIDYSPMYAYDEKLTAKENFRNKQNAGYIINVAGRNIGKSLMAFIDGFLTLIYGLGDESCISSFDFSHLKKLGTPIANFANYHPFFELFKKKGKEAVRWTGGGLEIDTTNGHVLYGRNENIGSPDPGTAYHSLHVKKNIYDEISYCTEVGRKKMVDAMSSEGCVERLSGIPDIRLGSFLGKLLLDATKKPFICNLPQMVRLDWDEKTKQEKITEYNGEESSQYKLNVLGEPIEGADSYFDMQRIRDNSYNTKRRIKTFEIGKESFSDFEHKIIIDNQPSTLKLICSDIGDLNSPSEICIYFGDNKLLKWRYNISLIKLTSKEQAKVFKWIYDKLETAIIGLDASDGCGRAIADELVSLGVPKERICRVMFQSNMIVGFETEKDENGNEVVICDSKGSPIHKLERTIDFANLTLANLLYEGKLEILHSEKFLTQFAGYFKVATGNTYKYGSSTDDHLLQSMQICAVTRFQNEFNVNQPVSKNTFVAGF